MTYYTELQKKLKELGDLSFRRYNDLYSFELQDQNYRPIDKKKIDDVLVCIKQVFGNEFVVDCLSYKEDTLWCRFRLTEKKNWEVRCKEAENKMEEYTREVRKQLNEKDEVRSAIQQHLDEEFNELTTAVHTLIENNKRRSSNSEMRDGIQLAIGILTDLKEKQVEECNLNDIALLDQAMRLLREKSVQIKKLEE